MGTIHLARASGFTAGLNHYTPGVRLENRFEVNRTFPQENKMKTFKIQPQLDDKNRARLEARQYTKAYTDIPNRVLPASIKEALGLVYQGLTGNELPEDGSTFTVRADDNGTFKALYSPTIFSTEDKNIIIRWGSEDISLSVDGGKLSAPSGQKGLKLSFKEEQIGKYTEPVLSVAYSSGGTVYTLPVPIRSADFENKLTSDILEALLSENPDAIAEQIKLASDPSQRSESSGSRLQGPFVKVAYLPLGQYKITTYRSKETDYGMDYFLQAEIPEPFTAPIRQKIDGEWMDVDTEVMDYAIVKPNAALKKVLAAAPDITPNTPAILEVMEHSEWNGHPTAKCKLLCTAFIDDADSLAIDF